MSQYERDPTPPALSGWASGGITFAGTIMILIGTFQAIGGLAAIFNDGFFVVANTYAFDLDVSAWGWIQVVIGAFVIFAGLSLFAGRVWAGVLALGLAAFSAVANFLYVPYYPFWSLLMIALAVWVIWALTRPGAVRA